MRLFPIGDVSSPLEMRIPPHSHPHLPQEMWWHLCDELEGRNAREMVIHALFGFFTQQVVLFTYRTCTYIGVVTDQRTEREKVSPR
jgi:hypothetical protein